MVQRKKFFDRLDSFNLSDEQKLQLKRAIKDIVEKNGTTTYLIGIFKYDDNGLVTFINSDHAVAVILLRSLAKNSLVMIGDENSKSPASICKNSFGKLVLTFQGADFKKHEITFEQNKKTWKIIRQRAWETGENPNLENIEDLTERVEYIENNFIMAELYVDDDKNYNF